MKKIFSIMAILLSLVMFTGYAGAAEHDYWASVYTVNNNAQMADPVAMGTKVTSGITFKVLAVGADTSETLTYYGGDTSLTNPVTTTSYASDTICNDRVAFRCDPTDATSDRYVDLIVVDTAGGYTTFVEDFDQYTHTIVIDERPNIMHHGCIWFAFYATATEIDTGIDFDYDTMINYVGVEIVTIDADETIDVGILSSGTNGDADGFIDGASLASTGYLLLALATSGALMDNGTNFDPDGYAVLSANEQSLTYTPSTSDTAYGYIHYFFTRMR